MNCYTKIILLWEENVHIFFFELCHDARLPCPCAHYGLGGGLSLQHESDDWDHGGLQPDGCNGFGLRAEVSVTVPIPGRRVPIDFPCVCANGAVHLAAVFQFPLISRD